MSTLPEPDFIARDPAALELELVAAVEAALGRTLQPAQVERILVSVMAYRESLMRQAVQDAALQNLVAFARYPMLDYLGELVGAARLPAVPATTTLRFTLVGAQAEAVVVPAGTRVQSADGGATFATDEDLAIVAGELTGDVAATSTEAGPDANDYAIGQVTEILDPVGLVESASNTTITADGAAIEDDEGFRQRIRLAPSQFSVAGSAAAYRYHARSVSSSIVEVVVTSPVPGTVRLYVLTDTGLPSAGLLADVEAALSAEDVRPLTDTVEVLAPTEVNYTIDATIEPLEGYDTSLVMAAVAAAAAVYVDERKSGLGRDIVPSQIVSALSVEGVYQVTLASPIYIEVLENEWANCTDITLTQGATAEG